jgi:hypothetical protein
MVADIVDDATKACIGRNNEINLHKLGIKLTLPEYSGSDSLEAFLRFAKEATKSLSLANLLKPEAVGLQTDFLGQMMKGKALTWYNHTIGNNTNQEISLSEALIALKRYFVKDASSRDAAAKFDSLKQGTRTVAELYRELERLTQQMVEPPSEYDLKRRFMNALKRETATEVTRLGYSLETRLMAELLQAARQVEQSQFYIEREDQESSKQFKPKGLKSSSSKPSGSKPRSYPNKEPFKGSNNNKTAGSSSYQNNKKTGYIPSKAPQVDKAARAARDVVEDAPLEGTDEQNESEHDSGGDKEAGSDEDVPKDNEDSDDESFPDEDDNLVDWAAAARISDDD